MGGSEDGAGEDVHECNLDERDHGQEVNALLRDVRIIN